jgi:hypothetical protein
MDFAAAVNGDTATQTPTKTPEGPKNPPAKRDPFDLKAVDKALEPFRNEIRRVLGEAKALEVTDDESNVQAAETLSTAKAIFKRIETKRKAIIEEPDGFVRAVNRVTKSLKDDLSEIEATIKPKMGRYAQEQERQRREAERRAQEEAKRLQAEAERRAKETNTEPVKVEAPAIPQKETPVRTAHGTTTTAKVWKHEVTDETKVPREYLMVNEAKVRQAVKDGVREIPGVNIFQETQVRVRT